MDSEPKTRRESKKSAKDKARGKDTCYSAKRVRQLEALQAVSGNNRYTQQSK